MLNYLVQASYLDFNPLSLMRRQSNRQIRAQINQSDIQERILGDDDWTLIRQTLSEWPESTSRERDEKARLRFIVAILYLLGLRIQELQSHTWNAFRLVQGKWWFMVVGKGDKRGKVPVNDDLLEEVKRFRLHLKLAELPSPSEDSPIIASWNGRSALGMRQISNLIKQLAYRAAEQVEDPAHADRIRRFSPHWLRHLSASNQDRAGIRFGHIKANHRHESDDTTRRYVHAMDDERHDDMAKLRLF
jgi:integrase